MNTITSHTGILYSNFNNTVPPNLESWNWYTSNKNGDVHIFEDTFLPEHVNYDGKIKIALILELPSIYDCAKQCNVNTFHPYEWIRNNHQHFNYILSPCRFLKDIVGENKYEWVLATNCFIPRDQFGMYEKERLLSAIASFKLWTPKHRMRHEIIKKYKSKLDVYGNGYNSIIDDYAKMGKIIALAPYYFTIVVPNETIDDFFSEQLTDAMAVGTIPIFCGTKNIKNYFNIDGIIQFDSIDQLDSIIPTLNKELYYSKIEAINENLEISKKCITTIEWLYNNKKEFLENI